MRFLVQSISPGAIGMTKKFLEEHKEISIITEIKNSDLYKDFDSCRIYYIDSINILELSKLIKHFINKKEVIEEFITLEEEYMTLIGELNEIYGTINNSQKTFNANLYSNKYYIRKFLEATSLKQPKFHYIDSQNKLDILNKLQENKKYIIKPLYGSGSEGVKLIDRNSISKNSLSPSIIEENIPHKKMYTTDGIFIGNKLVAFFINEYEEPILENVSKVEGHVTRTLNINTPIEIQKKLFENTLTILETFNTNEIRPFHFEWFYTLDGEIIFCEAAARFGGKIGYLLYRCYGINIFDIYWKALLNGDYKIKNNFEELKPEKIAFNFSAYKWDGFIKYTPNINGKYIFSYKVNTNEKIKKSYNILDPLFNLEGDSNNEYEYQKSIEEIKYFYNYLKEINS